MAGSARWNLKSGKKASSSAGRPEYTADRRYLIVRGRLWRATNPNIPAKRREALVRALMDARRAVKAALHDGNVEKLAAARAAVDAAKVGLGERGPPWWKDGAKDFNRHLLKNTPYAKKGRK